ncbi:MAG: methyltransferase domain-containing protein [Marinifilaceae bacterium]|nr:methyltransferase domain-containing protein [Marinifilaceae bacterium]
MAERANPDDQGFQKKWRICWIGGFLPVPKIIPNPYREALYWRYQIVARHCKGKKVIDIPCGMGWGTSMLRGCKSLLGIDISEEAIIDAKNRYGSIAEFRVGDMSSLNLPDASVDLISCLEGIEHVAPEIGSSFVRECWRVLRPEGEVIMSSPHCNDAAHSGNPYHIKEYLPEELRRLVLPYFEILNEERRIVDNLTVTMFHLRRRLSIKFEYVDPALMEGA